LRVCARVLRLFLSRALSLVLRALRLFWRVTVVVGEADLQALLVAHGAQAEDAFTNPMNPSLSIHKSK
jgi:hypothetical protein